MKNHLLIICVSCLIHRVNPINLDFNGHVNNRAYVDMTAPHPAGAPRAGVRRVVFDVQGSNAATGFGEVQGDELQSTKVLINGHLFIRRGEKTYDATGQLVK